MRRIYISAKCSDNFYAFLEEDGMKDHEYEGYVPKWFPDEHYGDYIMFDIDLDTGQILNWKPPTKEQVEETFGEAEKEEVCSAEEGYNEFPEKCKNGDAEND